MKNIFTREVGEPGIPEEFDADPSRVADMLAGAIRKMEQNIHSLDAGEKNILERLREIDRDYTEAVTHYRDVHDRDAARNEFFSDAVRAEEIAKLCQLCIRE